jgi:hypothetical protein
LDCKSGIDTNFGGYIEAKVHMGPGYYLYLVCVFASMLRALCHWVTPVPGRGMGCCPKLPAPLERALNGDGKVGLGCWNNGDGKV